MNLKQLALLSVAALLGTALVALAPVPQAVAQTETPPPERLDPELCESTYKPTDGRTTDFTVAQCKALVKFRNDIFAYSGHLNLARHSIAQWGTASTAEGKRMNKWLGIAMFGSPFQVTQLNIGIWQKGTNRVQNRTNGAFLAGPIPELDLNYPPNGEDDKSLFDGLSNLWLNSNRFTGEFPKWIYSLKGLFQLDIQGNELSGQVDGRAFSSEKLGKLNFSSNRFSGSLPNFRFFKGSQKINPDFTRLGLSGNSFSGVIPEGYSAFADGRPINDLAFSSNQISGEIPSWVKDLKFSTGSGLGHGVIWQPYFINRVSFENNRMCIPDDFNIGTLVEAGDNTTPASVQISFARNRCPTTDKESSYIPDPVRDLTYTIPSDNTNALRVAWKAPTGTGPYQYWVTPVKLAPDQFDQSVSVGDHCAVPTRNLTPDSQGIYTVTFDADTPATTACRFDPEKFGVNVRSFREIGTRTDGFVANGYTSESTSEPGWNVLHVKERKSMQEIGFKLGLGLNSGLYTWDLDNQFWVRWDLSDLSLDSNFPEIGTSIITTQSRPPAWLDIAGLSSADENLNIQLANGWNMIAAGGDSARPANDDGAFFIDENLLDCFSVNGVIAILRYRARAERFDVELPCHPASEVNLTRGESRGLIDEIEEYDSLFVYFNSVLPVCIRWDGNSKYVPAGIC